MKPARERENIKKKHTDMTTRTIPTSIPALIAFSGRSLSGAQALGVTLNLAQNTAARILADRVDLVGEPGPTPTIRGKEAEWQLKREALKTAQATRRVTIKAARGFWSNAVDLLKLHLGRTWNPAWEAAGFTGGTLATAKGDPEPMLLRIRGYLRDHPAHENAPLNVTAAQADVHIAAIQAAVQGVDTASAASKQAAAERKSSVKRLIKRLSGLRDELDQLLTPDDARWYEFGFSRPVDPHMPGKVTGLTATPGQPGQVLVQHAASARAENYRVSWKPQVSSGEPMEVGLFADLAVTLSGLPSGTTIVVSVTARNAAGETQPAEVTVVVP
jgi:hypothetical protein